MDIGRIPIAVICFELPLVSSMRIYETNGYY